MTAKSQETSRLATAASVVALVFAIGGPAAYLYLHPSPWLTALLQPLETKESEVVFASPAPGDTTTLTDSAPGYLWLFDEAEWRTSEAGREIKDGMLHLRTSMAKSQPDADGAIRARLLAREGGVAGVFLRSTPEGGRYRLAIDADRKFVRLFHDGSDGAKELGKYRFFQALQRADKVSLELRAEGQKISASVNGQPVIEVNDSLSKTAGTWGIESTDAWFELVEIPIPTPKNTAVAASSTPAPAAPEMTVKPSTPEPETTPMPAPVPVAAPAPVPLVPVTDTGKWLAIMEPQWQATFQQEDMAPYEKGAIDLRKQFRETIEVQFAAATQAKKVDDAAFLRGERKRLDDGEDIPMTDEPIIPASLKALRNGYRSELVRLDRERFNRAKILFTRIEGLLAQNQAALVTRKRPEEVAELTAKREQLSASWVKPPLALVVPPATVATTGSGSATPAPRLPLGSAMVTVATKLTPRQVVEKLLAMGAEVRVTARGATDSIEIKDLTNLPGDRFAVTEVNFLANSAKPPTEADFAILETLDDVTGLSLRGPAITDAVFEKMKNFRHLSRLTMEGTKITATGLAIMPTLTDLRQLELNNFPLNDDGAKWVGQCRKIEILRLSTSPITDAGLGFISKLSSLQELGLNDCNKIGAAGIAHLATTHSLKQLNLNGATVSSGMLESLAKCVSLETLTLTGNPLKDEHVAVLAPLTRLRALNLNNTGLVGTAFSTWATRTALTSLDLTNQPGVNDAALKAIQTAFPKLEILEIGGVAQGATAAGFASVGKLRSLRNLRVRGAVVNDAIMAEIARCDELQTLNIPAATLGDAGAAALAHLSKLSNLYLDAPPVTDVALKSLARCKMLKTLHVSETIPAEAEAKLSAALQGVEIRK